MTETKSKCYDCGTTDAATGTEPVCYGSHLRGRYARKGLCREPFDLTAYLRGRNAQRAKMRRERREKLWGRG
jgi:hypothetical protein